jgi:hypothetical protein
MKTNEIFGIGNVNCRVVLRIRSVFDSSVRSLKHAALPLLAVGVLMIVMGCAIGPKKALHGLEFDAVFNMTDIEIIDYKYGDGPAFPIRTRCRPKVTPTDKCAQSESANLLTEIGETLYVKWKIKSTGEILDDTIIMKKVLPDDINGMKLFFYIKQRQLYLFLDTRLPKPKGWPEYEVMGYQYYKNYQLYPTSNLTK